ncbi:hypothetical protein [Oceanobacillus bengalensis]|uniref:Uncharacterized protein n=1 Tax=Oceanobacillus bengalensis TaxID=1435466 RepID=A0A494YSL0_9BACI|nr:hypothetical protein [Oceanobacillus bengalensis]RKQ12892.1 hypothetical protein D8M05_17625 [Oceanobacillus bengalensis]
MGALKIEIEQNSHEMNLISALKIEIEQNSLKMNLISSQKNPQLLLLRILYQLRGTVTTPYTMCSRRKGYNGAHFSIYNEMESMRVFLYDEK